MKSYISIAALSLGAMTAAASAQFEGKTALGFRNLTTQKYTLNAAASLGMTTLDTWTEATFYQALASQQWDLLVIEVYNDQAVIFDKPKFITTVKDWIAGGGRLIFTLTNLDEYPELWEPLGIASVKEKSKPHGLRAHPPGNPVYVGGITEFGFDAWPDNGDELTMLPGAYECAYFFMLAGEPTASVVYNDSRTICNGFDWDSLSSSPALPQVEYVMYCRGDFDKDMTLTVFDFLAFINSFFSFQPRFCNVTFDTAVDLFDFTEFQNLFMQGCKE